MQNPNIGISKDLDVPHPKASLTNLIINYLPVDVEDKELFDMFSTFGEIRSSKIVRDSSGQSVGYGFVDFVMPKCAKLAQIILNGSPLRNKHLKVDFALPRSKDSSKANLFVEFLPPDMSERGLEALFGRYGNITSVKLLRAKITFGNFLEAYVRFKQPIDAEKARIALNGYIFAEDGQPISVRTAKAGKRYVTKVYKMEEITS